MNLAALILSLFLLTVAPCRQGAAAPYLPKDDGEVLERLPYQPLNQSFRRLREELSRASDNLPLATQLARRFIEEGRATSDPRYFGYAQGVLAPWWDQSKPPTEVLVLRATLRQNRHDFENALTDLSQVLAKDPRHAQSWLTRAVILQIRGNYEEARRSCLALLNLTEPLFAVSCLCGVGSLSGQAAQSHEVLKQAVESYPSASAKARFWALTTLAETAVRLGKHTEAEQHFHAALALASQDAYLLGAYADYLLDRDRPQEVADLLKDETRVDGLLLRLTLAEKRLGSGEFAGHVDALRARFAASRMRGDTLHQGEEARFTLHLLNQPEEALRLAQTNWAVQREPRDARILIESALAANDRAAALPVIAIIKKTSLEDVQLARLVAALEEWR